MPEHDNDKLEDFFKKAASRPDIFFHEEDWKKLEARLDAEITPVSAFSKNASKIAAAITVSLLLVGGGYWFSSHLGDRTKIATDIESPPKGSNESQLQPENGSRKLPAPSSPASDGIDRNEASKGDDGVESDEPPVNVYQDLSSDPENPDDKSKAQPLAATGDARTEVGKNALLADDNQSGITPGQQGVRALDNQKIFEELIKTSHPIVNNIKQKASVVLSGAEEEDLRVADSIVKEEFVFDEKKQLVTPRLSLLLSIAPDFSGTSLNQYSAPGKAYGLFIHYHLRNAWSISGGIVSNKKVYTGDGEDYQPPKNYWKYYTNGVVPRSIDGSCNILEFPVMLQYMLAEKGRSRFMVSAGASSYIMLSESYRYNFEQPNPGARDGWDSKRSSRFTFNMVNFTLGYERQIFSGLMVGVEPYLKIPIEEIGWSNLRLFSAGASVTLRYTLLRKGYSSLPVRSRGPD